MRAYVINLDRSRDRLAHMQSEFDRIGAGFSRYPAIDGRDIGDREITAFTGGRSDAWDGHWIAGEVAIFRSHMSVWQEIAERADRAAAVFEDDVHLADDLASLLASDAWLPHDADVVRLEANRKLTLRDGRTIDVTPKRRIFRVLSGTWGAAGYILTRTAAARLVEAAPETRCPVDVFLFKPGRSTIAASLTCYQVVPAVCIQEQLLAPDGGRYRSLVGTAGRTPAASRGILQRWAKVLPWKKQPVPFRP